MLTEVMLETESPDGLENGRLQHAKPFVRQRLRRIAGAFLVIAALAVFVGVKSIGTRGFFVGLAVGAGIASAVCVPYAFFQLYRISLGPPRAPTTPEESLKKYLEACLLPGSDMEFDTVGMEGYLYLLARARQEFGDVEAFKKYWQELNYSFRKELQDKLNYYQTNLLAAKTIEDIRVDYRGQRIASCSTTLEVEVGWTNSKLATEGLKMGRLGHVYYQVKTELGKVGERWYVASGKWNGTVTKVLKGSDQKFKYML
jgi:hypothetical protein